MTKRYKKLEGDQCFYLVPPNVQVAMCGVKYASQDKNGFITLTYTDGTTESASATEYDIGDKNIFEICGDVQEKARKAA